jgi:hypothetical protein
LPDGAVGSPPFVTVGNTSRDQRGAGYIEHFRLRRRNAFSPGSKVESGLKALTKASLSTSAPLPAGAAPASSACTEQSWWRPSQRPSLLRVREQHRRAMVAPVNWRQPSRTTKMVGVASTSDRAGTSTMYRRARGTTRHNFGDGRTVLVPHSRHGGTSRNDTTVPRAHPCRVAPCRHDGHLYLVHLWRHQLRNDTRKNFLHPVTPLAVPGGVARQPAFAAPHAAVRQGCHAGLPWRARQAWARSCHATCTGAAGLPRRV